MPDKSSITKWRVPAKTFLIGEYAAIKQGPSIILTTKPCFELHLNEHGTGLENIHPDSPAGSWYHQQAPIKQGLHFIDPYNGQGGLGASTAQFISVYRAYHDIKQLNFSIETMLSDYFKHAYSGKGKKPSGHDLMAQSYSDCVAFDGNTRISFPWPFKDLGFTLIRTGNKLATHEHLSNLHTNIDYQTLSNLSLTAIKAFQTRDTKLLLNSINDFAQSLQLQNLVAEPTQHLLTQLKQHPSILAAKGCGAMGADFIIALHPPSRTTEVKALSEKMQLTPIATQQTLY